MTKFRILAIAALLLASTFVAKSGYAQVDSCLALFESIYTNAFNPDSVMFDTCGPRKIYQNQFAFDTSRIYAKRRFGIKFDYFGVLPIGPYPNASFDTIVDVGWQQIDTSYPSVRAAFQEVQAIYGSFRFRKLDPAYADTSNAKLSALFDIYFDNYVNVDSAAATLSRIPLAHYVTFGQLPMIGNIGVKTSSNYPGRMPARCFPNPASDVLHIQSSALGRIVLTNLAGQTVMNTGYGTATNATIMLSQIPAGLYFLRSGNRAFKFSIIH